MMRMSDVSCNKQRLIMKKLLALKEFVTVSYIQNERCPSTKTFKQRGFDFRLRDPLLGYAQMVELQAIFGFLGYFWNGSSG